MQTFFIQKKSGSPFDSVLSSNELNSLLKKNSVILPKARKYYIETLESHFNHVKLSLDSDLPTVRKVIEELYPDYVPAFDACIKRTWGHMFNMFIMRKDMSDKYCEWLFTILGELENRIDMSELIHPARRRIIGYLAEFMLDIWIEKNNIPYKEVNTVFIEKQNEVKKIYKFLVRKIRSKKK